MRKFLKHANERHVYTESQLFLYIMLTSLT